MSALKRIEEKHQPYGEHPGCPEYQQLGDPCDVVKLARALDEAADMLRRHGWPICAFALKRTLEEVAGEPAHQV